jgi:hypothetical protein
MTLEEACRMHEIELPEPDITGKLRFTFRPAIDANTHRSFMALSDYGIHLIHDVHPQERETVVVLSPK